MIVFDLRCESGHVFEAWFASSDDYRDRLAAGTIACPTCGDHDVARAVTAPRINGGAVAPVSATPCGQPACASGRCAFADAD